mgnify:CR=1 FL=1
MTIVRAWSANDVKRGGCQSAKVGDIIEVNAPLVHPWTFQKQGVWTLHHGGLKART